MNIIGFIKIIYLFNYYSKNLNFTLHFAIIATSSTGFTQSEQVMA